MIPLIGGIGWQEILLVAAVIFILFGASRLPAAFRSLGEGLRIFKDGLQGGEAKKGAGDSTESKSGSESAPASDGGETSSKRA